MEWANSTALAKQGVKERVRQPFPTNWVPAAFLTWIYFGPLSKYPELVICLEVSGSGVKKQEVWETGPREGAEGADSKGSLGFASAVQRINYNSGASRRQLQKQKREEGGEASK